MRAKTERPNFKMHTELADISAKQQDVERAVRKTAEAETIRLQLDSERSELEANKSSYQSEREALNAEKNQWERINKLSAKDISALQTRIDGLLVENEKIQKELLVKEKILLERLQIKDEEISELQNQINQLNLELIDLSNQDVIDELKQKVEELSP